MSRPNTSKPFDVAIVGGGIAGLCLAIGLLKNGIAITIYEAADSFGEIGAGVGLGPSAFRAMKGIDPRVEEGFNKVATTSECEDQKCIWFNFRHGEGARAGEKLFSLGCDDEYQHAGVHRARFLEELVELIPNEVVRFDKRLTDIQEADKQVQLVFKDGSVSFHDCVVGCDGIRSEVRTYILGKDDPAAKPVFSGKYCHRGLAPMSVAIGSLGVELATNGQFYPGRHRHILTRPIDHGNTLNIVAFGSCPTWENKHWVVPSSYKDIDETFLSADGPVKQIVKMLHGKDIWALYHHLPARTYYKGNVAMIGDAAHASTPHQGAGAGMAIEDAFVLSSLFAKIDKKSDIPTCLEAFDAVRRQRGNALVKTSYEAGLLWDMELPGVEGDMDRLRENAEQRMRWIWDEDLDEEVEQGSKLIAKAF